jgi:hypothetical protein
MLIRIIKFDQLDDYIYPYSLNTLGIKPSGVFLDYYKVIDERLFFLAVIKCGIEYEELVYEDV